MSVKFCCKEMQTDVLAGTIIRVYIGKMSDFDLALKNNTLAVLSKDFLSYKYYIRGKPSFVYDGDNHYDNRTSETEINYCPFCGKKLKERKQ